MFKNFDISNESKEISNYSFKVPISSNFSNDPNQNVIMTRFTFESKMNHISLNNIFLDLDNNSINNFSNIDNNHKNKFLVPNEHIFTNNIVNNNNNNKRAFNQTKILNRYKCDICNKRFKRKDYLKNHLFQIHSGYKGIKCKYCGKIRKRIKDHQIVCKLKYGNKVPKEEISNATELNENIDLKPSYTLFINDNDNGEQIILKNIFLDKKLEFISFTEFIYYPDFIIGTGGNMIVYYGKDKLNNDDVAVKIKINKKRKSNSSKEAIILTMLKDIKQIPSFLYYEYYDGKDIMVENLLGPSLQSIFNYKSNLFDFETVAIIGIQIFSILKNIHKKGVLHNDIKPNNICWGKFKNSKLIDTNLFYLIDFGYSREYGKFEKIGKNNGDSTIKFFKHYENKYEYYFEGTSPFMAISKSEGQRPCRKTDCEELLYTLFYLMKNRLPWGDIKGNNHVEKCKKMAEKKKQILKNGDFNDIPREFLYIYKSIINLEFAEEPDYDMYNIILKNLLANNNKITTNNEKFHFNEKLNNFIKNIRNDLSNSGNNNNIINIFEGYPI